VLPAGQGPVVGNVARVFARQIQDRCEAKVITTGDAPLTVELAIAPGIGAEGFRIEDRPGGGVRIVGIDFFPKYLLETGVPGRLGLLNFPEISMFGMNPWGGYGANPAPAHFEKLWGRIKHMAAGGAPYSEGVYEDLNKAIYAQFYWDPGRKAEETVREYAAFEFSPDVAANIVEVVRIFERNHHRNAIGADAVKAFELIARADATLRPAARSAWRWRIVYLRALIDKELFERKGKLEGEPLKSAFGELTRIYHAENAHSMPIKPPQMK